MLKILGRTSSINVRKVLWLCAEMGLAYDHELWGTGFESTRAPEFLALNPNGLVPVLRDGDFVLWESNVVCRYLARREGRTDLLPDEPHRCAIVEQWMDWQAADLNPSWMYAFLALVRRSPAHTDPAAIEASVSEWNRKMAILDARLARTGAFVAGSGFTLADIALGLSVHRWRMAPIAHAMLPAVEAYHERLREREGFQRYSTNELP
jgi:glutathione S-transferase